MAIKYIACWVSQIRIHRDGEIIEAWLLADCGHQHQTFAQVDACLPLGGFVRAVERGEARGLTEAEIAEYVSFLRQRYPRRPLKGDPRPERSSR